MGEKVKLKIDAKQVENELELRSVEISDLQQKLLDIHQGYLLYILNKIIDLGCCDVINNYI